MKPTQAETKRAAHQYRLWQVEKILRNLMVTFETNGVEKTVPAFVETSNGGWTPNPEVPVE